MENKTEIMQLFLKCGEFPCCVNTYIKLISKGCFFLDAFIFGKARI